MTTTIYQYLTNTRTGTVHLCLSGRSELLCGIQPGILEYGEETATAGYAATCKGCKRIAAANFLPQVAARPERMGASFIVTLLDALPSYTEIEIEMARPEVRATLRGETTTHRLMARDFPRPGRRFTNLTTGTEWFIDAESLERINAVAVRIPGLNLEVGR
jgi:hypothetical protein